MNNSRSTCWSGLRFVLFRFALLLVGLTLPGTAPLICECVIATEAETEAETSFEDVFEECLSPSQARRPRRYRASYISVPHSSYHCIPSAASHTGHRITGHRISNGLLAPLKC